MPGPSSAEIAARVVCALIDMSEQRGQRVEALSKVVARAVEEIDPTGERDHTPTWWQDMPAWMRLDAFDRFRRAHDQLAVLEAQASMVVQDLRGMLALKPVGSAERPVGYTPAKAHAALLAMAPRRAEMLEDLRKAERLLHAKMSKATAAAVRHELREIDRSEKRAAAARDKLSLLIGFGYGERQAS